MDRKTVNILLLAFICFALYNTLIPFHFQPHGHSFKTLIQSVEWRFFIYKGRRAPLTDIAGNILLFIPLGFLLYLWFYQRRFRGASFLTAISGVLFSMLIEFLQLFVKDRISSVTDIFNNTLGTVFGGLAASLYFRAIAAFVNREARRLIREQPITLFLIAVFILQVVGNIVPFNVSITISDLKNSIKHISIMPFQNQTVSFLLFHQPTGLDSQAFNWFMFFENIFFWSVWGYVTALCYDSYWTGRKNGKWLILTVGFMPAILLEFLQIFIVSRYCDINDIISNWTGVFWGLVIYSLCRSHRSISSSGPWRTLNCAAGLYFIFILFAGLQPFDFHFSMNNLQQAINYQKLIPFLCYFNNTSIWNISDLIGSLLYFFPISLYVSYRMFLRRYHWPSIYFFTIIASLLIGILIEFSQLYSPTRVGDITDALLYGLGGFLGAFSLYYFLNEIRPSLEL